MIIKTPIYTVYLLHFDQPVGKAQHYCGVCKAHRLHWRMMEHRNGRGAALTAEAYRQGIGFTVVREWLSDTAELEQEIKRKSFFKRHCWICSPAVEKPPSRLLERRYNAVAPPLPFKALDAVSAPRTSRYRP